MAAGYLLVGVPDVRVIDVIVIVVVDDVMVEVEVLVVGVTWS